MAEKLAEQGSRIVLPSRRIECHFRIERGRMLLDDYAKHFAQAGGEGVEQVTRVSAIERY
jgi:hypothetical protein